MKKFFVRCSIYCLSAIVLVFIFLNFIQMAESKFFWPPQLGEKYPDIELIDQEGEKFYMSDLKGDVIFIEYVGMNCPRCQAFSGANSAIGPYQNNSVEKGLKSIEEYCPTYTKGIPLSDERIVYVQILLYDMKMQHPTFQDAHQWAEHFLFLKEEKQYITVPTKDMRSPASYNLIPGFHLVDKNFILRSDSAGHHPKQNWWKVLLPMIPELLEE